MRKTAICVAITTIFLLLTACGGKSESNNREHIVRLDSLVYTYPDLTGTEQERMIEEYNQGLDILRHVMRADTLDMATWLNSYSQSAAVQKFTPDVLKYLPSIDSVEIELSALRANIESTLPSVKMPRVYGIVSPFNQSIILVDTTAMLIGLNHYLGSNYAGYSVFEPYQRYTKRAKFIPIDVAEALVATTFPYQEPTDGLGSTVLSQMMYQGALIEAKRRLLPNADEAEIMGYTPEEMVYLHLNEANLWDALVGKNLLYSTDPMDQTRLLNPAPTTSILTPDAPGRAARYLGYKIVKAYIDQYNASLGELLSPVFYNNPQCLVLSKYQGR